MRHVTPLVALGIDTLLWFSLPVAFLLVYVQHFSAPVTSVLPHLELMALPFVFIGSFRIGSAALVRSNSAIRLATALLTSTAVLLLLAYYALVLIGLEYWGRIISWSLITSYAAQSQELTEAIGLSRTACLVALVLLHAALALSVWTYTAYFDWVPILARSAPRAVLLAGALVGGIGVSIQIFQFHAAPATRAYEPVSMTLFPLEGASLLQGHGIDRLKAARLDEAEDRLRATYKPDSESSRRNLVLIVVDALRPDHMGVYGYHRDTTPNLDRLDREGKLRKWSQVHSVCASSSCGIIALISSKFIPEFHRRPFSLHEALKRHGYRLNLILGGDHRNFYGLKEMYGAVDSYFDGSQTINRTNDDHALLEELAKFPNWDGTPVMFHFHLMSAHVLGKRNSDNFRFTPAASYALPTGRDGTSGVNFYDNGVLQADGIIHEIQQALRAKGYLKDALVVVTADHGESLGEHGLYVHTNSVRQAALRIPFLLISHGGPRAQPIDVDRYASQVDIPATVLTDLGVPIPSSWSGVPMQKPTGRAYSPFQERAEVGILDHRDAKVPHKYWMNTDTRAEYVFDLAADPLEESNLVRQVPEELLREWRRQVFKSGQADRVHEAE